MVRWAKILNLPPNRNYEISTDGQVKNTNTGDIIKSSITNSGYERVILGSKYNNKVIWRYVHRLVAEMFIGKLGKLDVNHIDGDKLNNNLTNLEICTRSQNKKHAYDILGIKPHNIKLTKQQAERIRYEIKNSGFTQRKIAKIYNVSPMLVSRIRHLIQKEYR